MKLNAIDHVHVYVEDLADAIKWYETILGFTIAQSFYFWYEQGGPLVINNSNTHLSLFKRVNQFANNTIAFSTNKQYFLDFIHHLNKCSMPFTVEDHQVSLSMYISDPDENKYEITTYDYFDLKKTQPTLPIE
ncbi:catechol-2,3-dioxygenase [Providencia alcalifaciens]|nr:catechol-2,3-dioxygenase [Providencia alcalifaciens]